MSTTTNVADQDVYPEYEFDLDGEFFAELLETIIDPGVWTGFDPTIIDSTTVSISPGVMVLDDSGDRLVKVETNSAFEQQPTPDNPYGVARFSWVNESDRFAEFRIDDAYDNFDVILYRATFDGSDNLDTLDLSERTIPRLVDHEQRISALE